MTTPRRLNDLPALRRIDMPPVWLAGFAAAAWLIAQAAPGDLGGWVTVAGWALVAEGVALLIWAAAAFQRARTTIVPHLAPSALVTSGPYAVSRNPIYLGDALVLAGLCLVWGSLLALVLVPAFMVLIDRRFIRAEEARLQAAFGPEFDAWAARVRRWI